MRFTTDGLIIREQQVAENDRLVTVLTRDKGIIKAFASGAMRLKGKNVGTSLLCFSNISLYKSRDTYKIDEASVIELFFQVRNDIESLSLASYFCELCLCFAPEEDNAEDFLRIMLNALAFLCNKKRPHLLIKAVMELRMAAMAGYMPDLVKCICCGTADDETMYLEPLHGNIYCESCKTGSSVLVLTTSVLAAARHIVYSELDKVFHFTLPDTGLVALSNITEAFVKAHSERNFQTLDFYNSLFPEVTNS